MLLLVPGLVIWNAARSFLKSFDLKKLMTKRKEDYIYDISYSVFFCFCVCLLLAEKMKSQQKNLTCTPLTSTLLHNQLNPTLLEYWYILKGLFLTSGLLRTRWYQQNSQDLFFPHHAAPFMLQSLLSPTSTMAHPPELQLCSGSLSYSKVKSGKMKAKSFSYCWTT